MHELQGLIVLAWAMLPVYTSCCYCIGLMTRRFLPKGSRHTEHTAIQGCYILRQLIDVKSVGQYSR